MDKIVIFREPNYETMPKVELPLGIVIYLLLSSVTLKR